MPRSSKNTAAPRRSTWPAIVAVLAIVGLLFGSWLIVGQIRAAWAFRQATLDLQGNQTADARALLDFCLAIWPDDAETHWLAARAARRAGDFAAAGKLLDRAAKLDWAPEAIRFERCLLTAQTGELASVEATLRQWLVQGHPDSDLILEVLTPLFLADYRLEDAAKLASLWIDKDPDCARAWALRGEAFALLRSTSALDSLQRAVELDPNDDASRLRFAGLIIEMHKAGEARMHLEILSRKYPNKPAVRLALAQCYREQAQPDVARQLLDALLTEQPDDANALREYGRLEMDADRPLEAERWWRKAQAITPADPELLHALAGCLERNGKPDEAKQVRDRLAQSKADLALINELSKQVALDPHDPQPRCEIGKKLIANGFPREGARWIATALRENPRHRPSHEALADYYRQVGDENLARQHRDLASKPSSGGN